MLYAVSSWMIFSSATWLLFSSASTVERRTREVSRSRSRSTSLATAEAASSMAVTALSSVSRSRLSMGRILPEAVALVVALRGHVRVYHGPNAHDGEQDPANKNACQRAVYKLDDDEDHTFADLTIVDLAKPRNDEAEDGSQYRIAHEYSSLSTTSSMRYTSETTTRFTDS